MTVGTVQNHLQELSQEAHRCAMLAHAAEMIMVGGSSCANDATLRESVIISLAEVIAASSRETAERLWTLSETR